MASQFRSVAIADRRCGSRRDPSRLRDPEASTLPPSRCCSRSRNDDFPFFPRCPLLLRRFRSSLLLLLPCFSSPPRPLFWEGELDLLPALVVVAVATAAVPVAREDLLALRLRLRFARSRLLPTFLGAVDSLASCPPTGEAFRAASTSAGNFSWARFELSGGSLVVATSVGWGPCRGGDTAGGGTAATGPLPSGLSFCSPPGGGGAAAAARPASPTAFDRTAPDLIVVVVSAVDWDALLLSAVPSTSLLPGAPSPTDFRLLLSVELLLLLLRLLLLLSLPTAAAATALVVNAPTDLAAATLPPTAVREWVDNDGGCGLADIEQDKAAAAAAAEPGASALLPVESTAITSPAAAAAAARVPRLSGVIWQDGDGGTDIAATAAAAAAETLLGQGLGCTGTRLECEEEA